jgi:predicted dehydrogenase
MPEPARSRRQFLSTAARACSALALPAFLPGAARAFAANERVGVGLIGIGGRGGHHLSATLGTPDVAVAAVCDVDAGHLRSAHAATSGKAEACPDYRAVLDRKDIDAVVVATPDHWHSVVTIDAVGAGKDVYVEKPLSTTLAEGRAMVSAARKHKRIVQVGINHRSEGYVRSIVEIICGGRIGKVREVKCWMWANPVEEPTPPETPPKDLDWDRWLGPAPSVPYHPKRAHYSFRWARDYAGGYMTDWGVHMLNVVTFAMDIDQKGPSLVEASGRYAPRNLYDFPIAMTARFEVKEPDFTLWWIQPADGGDILPGEKYGMTFYGEDGQLRTNFGEHKFFRDGKEAPLPREGKPVNVPKSPGHLRNWLDSIRSRELPIADVEIGHRTTSFCQLGNAALWTGRPLRWDWEKEVVIDDQEATRLLSRPFREPYAPRADRA